MASAGSRARTRAFTCATTSGVIASRRVYGIVLSGPVNPRTRTHSWLIPQPLMRRRYTSALVQTSRLATLMVGFYKRISVTSESLTDANRGVNILAGTRSMAKIAGLAMGGVHLSALHSPFQSAREVLRMR
jgi:hypothetical protein